MKQPMANSPHQVSAIPSLSILQFTIGCISMVSFASAELYHVIPTQAATCPDFAVSCMTLSQYAALPISDFSPNTTFVLQPGDHNLDSVLKIKNITFVSVIGDSMSEVRPTIACGPQARFEFSSISSIQISGIEFVDCVGNTIVSVDQLSLENCSLHNRKRCGTGLVLKWINLALISTSSFSITHTQPFNTCVSEQVAAAVFMHGCNVSITAVSFDGVSTKDTSILYILNSTATIDDTSFSNNMAELDVSVYVVDSTVSVRNSQFVNNTCLGDANHFTICALYCRGSSVVIDNSSFVKHLFSAGAVLRADNSTFVISNSVLSNIESKTYGGVLRAVHSTLTISSNLFANNTKIVTDVVFLQNSSVNMDNLVFMNNKAINASILFILNCSHVTLTAGAFLNNEPATSSSTVVVSGSSLSVVTSKFLDNTAFYSGILFTDRSFVKISDSIFHNNTADYSSGVIGSSNSTISLNNSQFVENLVRNGKGGVMFILSTQLTIRNSTFIMNKATYGGALYARTDSHISIQGSVFASNTALDSGGAVLVETGTIVIDSSTFHNNTALAGGAMNVFGGTVIVNSSQFFSNKAYYQQLVSGAVHNVATIGSSIMGGALFANQSVLAIQESSFVNNSVSIIVSSISEPSVECNSEAHTFLVLRVYGGAIYVHNGSTIVENSTFIQNLVCVDTPNHNNCTVFENSTIIGGAIASKFGRIEIRRTNFTKNQADIGYTVATMSFSTTVSFASDYGLNPGMDRNVTVAVRTSGASAFGYAVGLDRNIAAEISDCVFINNVANTTGVGGAVYIGSTPSVQIFNTTFSKNVAGINNPLDTIHQNFSNCTIPGANSGQYTAALLAINSTLSIEESLFLRNRALSGGIVGAVLGSNVTITTSTFADNTADSLRFLFDTVYVTNSSASIHNCVFSNNSGGAVTIAVADKYNVQIDSCTFVNNSAYLYGGALFVLQSNNIVLNNSTFTNNFLVKSQRANIFDCALSTVFSRFLDPLQNGGFYVGSAILSLKSGIQVTACTVTHNTNRAFFAVQSIVTVNHTVFSDNVAVYGGAVSVTNYSTITIQYSTFTNNACTGKYTCSGAALMVDNSRAEAYYSVFEHNTAYTGGAVDVVGGTIVMRKCRLVHNTAIIEGAAMYLESTSFNSSGFLYIENNSANSVLRAINSSIYLQGTNRIARNNGSLFAFYSNMTFSGSTHIFDNVYYTSSLQSAGLGKEYSSTITSYHSDIVFTDSVSLTHNKAVTGGAILARESKIYFYGHTTISENSASFLGGGIYASQSELNFMGITKMTSNIANLNGGAVHMTGATARLIGGDLEFVDNTARRGGAISLELNSKLYLFKTASECMKYDLLCTNTDSSNWLNLDFVNNTADYGGALYVNDEANFGTCAASASNVSDCFFQALALYNGHEDAYISLNLHNTVFSNNTANIEGHTIYGGLLDRCSLNPLAEIFKRHKQFNLPVHLDAFSYLVHYNVTSLKERDIQSAVSSEPVRVCFCNNSLPDCSYRQPSIFVRKGERFKISVVAVDQVNNTKPNTVIHSAVSSFAGLQEGQDIQVTNETCTDLLYNVVSPFTSEQVVLYAEGPCKDSGISATSFDVVFKVCPIGFKDSSTDCECDPDIYPDYITTCSIENESVLRKDNIWITYINTTDQEGYLIYSHCPYDFCYPSSVPVWINLNEAAGVDAQCAYNHSGTLCGRCKEGLSLSLGSSQCIPCSNNWLVLLIPFFIAGLALVAFLLVFNMTVDKGTLNGLILYANTIGTNRAILFPFKSSNVLSIFIAWLNLDFGFETCFFDGMTGYAKTWLQLAFPLYIIFLVTMVIVGCEHSEKLNRFLRRMKWNPLTTLSTLILLTYTKLIRTIIAALSFAKLEYPDGSHKMVWLFDASVPYFGWKHAPLFLTGILILILGLTYTLILLLWQVLQRCPYTKSLKWMTSTKLYAFVDAYHAPYNPKHLYWTGLLLLARVLLYLVSSFNVNHDPAINLLAIVCVATCLLLLIGNPAERVYRKWPLSVLESSFLFNLIIFSTVTSYVRGIKGDQRAIACISIGIAFCTFIGIIIYHTYEYILKPCLLKISVLPRRRQGAETHHLLSDTSIGEALSDEPTYTEIDGFPTPLDTYENEIVLNRKTEVNTSDSEEEESSECHTTSRQSPKEDSVSEHDSASESESGHSRIIVSSCNGRSMDKQVFEMQECVGDDDRMLALS